MNKYKSTFVFLAVLAIFLYWLVYPSISVNKQADFSFIISPVETLMSEDDGDYYYGLPQRQKVELRIQDTDSLDTVTISSEGYVLEDSELEQWQESKDGNNSKISKQLDQELYVLYQDKVVFSTHDFIYDYIHFNTVCSGADGQQQLAFSMVRGGSANGEIEDVLFVYLELGSDAFLSRVIERRYLPELCDMDDAVENKAEQEQMLEDINAIHEQLRPSATDTYPADYVESQQALPSRVFSNAELESILTEFRSFMPIEIDVEEHAVISEEEYPNFYEPDYIIQDIAEDNDWRIVEVLYLQLYVSWGVFLAENKQTGQWTSFYTVSGGDSKQHLYFDDDVEIIDGELIGIYSAYGDQQLAISLNDFTVIKTPED